MSVLRIASPGQPTRLISQGPSSAFDAATDFRFLSVPARNVGSMVPVLTQIGYSAIGLPSSVRKGAFNPSHR